MIKMLLFNCRDNGRIYNAFTNTENLNAEEIDKDMMDVETSSVNHLNNIQSVDTSKMPRMFTTSHYLLTITQKI